MAHDPTPITIHRPGDGHPVQVPAHQYETLWFPRGYRKSTAAAKKVTATTPNEVTREGTDEEND